MNLLEQKEILRLMERYNNTPRRVIKENLFRMKDKKGLTKNDIMIDLGLEKSKVDMWFNRSNSNIAIFYDALRLATTYGFDVTELMSTDIPNKLKEFKYPIEQDIKQREYFRRVN